MTGVVLVWLLQIGAVFYYVFSGIDGSGFAARFRRACTHGLVIGLALGLIGFLLAGMLANAQGNYGGVSAAASSFGLQLSVLVVVFVVLLFSRQLRRLGPDMVFGSARFADFSHANAAGLIGFDGMRLGKWRFLFKADAPYLGQPLQYTGERHLLTIAPTRAGKGVSTIIPNLLTFLGSAIIIDPKGENAKITHARRSRIGTCRVIDPWGITGLPAASFNPLDILTPDSPTLIEDALLIADALVIPDRGGQSEFWSDQARAFIVGFLLHLATSPEEAASKNLGRLRDILSASPDEFAEVGIAMARSDVPAVRAAAARIISQNDEVRASIISTAQQNTHFLDSPALRRSLEGSDFQFADLKGEKPVSVYIVLPVDRIGTYSRWLRLMIALGIAQLARTPNKGARSVLFMLDEFAQLGRLQVVEEAYGLMAGMGIQLHAIVQDLSQLNRLYPDSWQTFLANAGAIQIFGTRDLHTAEYFSKMLGQTTATVHSSSTTSGTSSSSEPGSPTSSSSSSSFSQAPTARPLLFPDELMRMDRAAQLLFIENADPVLADKIVWHTDPELAALANGHAVPRAEPIPIPAASPPVSPVRMPTPEQIAVAREKASALVQTRSDLAKSATKELRAWKEQRAAAKRERTNPVSTPVASDQSAGGSRLAAFRTWLFEPVGGRKPKG